MSIPPIVTYDVLSEMDGVVFAAPTSSGHHRQSMAEFTLPDTPPRGTERNTSPPRSTSPTTAAMINSTNSLLGISTEVHTSKLVATLTSIVNAIQSQSRKHNNVVVQMVTAGKERRELADGLRKDFAVHREWAEARDKHWQGVVLPAANAIPLPPIRLDDRFVAKSNFFTTLTPTEIENKINELSVNAGSQSAAIARLLRNSDPNDSDTIAAEEERRHILLEVALERLGSSDALRTSVAHQIKEALSAPLQIQFSTPSESDASVMEETKDQRVSRRRSRRASSIMSTPVEGNPSSVGLIQSAIADFVGIHLVEPSILSVGEEIRDLRIAHEGLASTLQTYLKDSHPPGLTNESDNGVDEPAGKVEASSSSTAPQPDFESSVRRLVKSEMKEVTQLLITSVMPAIPNTSYMAASRPSDPSPQGAPQGTDTDSTAFGKAISGLVAQTVNEAVKEAMGDLRKEVVKEIMGQVNNGSIIPHRSSQSAAANVSPTSRSISVEAPPLLKGPSPIRAALSSSTNVDTEKEVLRVRVDQLEAKVSELSGALSKRQVPVEVTQESTAANTPVLALDATNQRLGRQSPGSRPTSANARVLVASIPPPAPVNFHSPLYGEVQQLWQSLRDGHTESKAKQLEVNKRLVTLEGRLAEVVAVAAQQETLRKMSGVASKARSSNTYAQQPLAPKDEPKPTVIGTADELLADPTIFVTNSSLAQQKAKITSDLLATTKEMYVDTSLMRTMMAAVDSKLEYLGRQVKELQLYTRVGLAAERGRKSTHEAHSISQGADGASMAPAHNNAMQSGPPIRLEIDDLYEQVNELRSILLNEVAARSAPARVGLASTLVANTRVAQMVSPGPKRPLPPSPRAPDNTRGLSTANAHSSSRRPGTGGSTASSYSRVLPAAAPADKFGLAKLLPKRPLTATSVDAAEVHGLLSDENEGSGDGIPHSVGASLYHKAVILEEQRQRDGGLPMRALLSGRAQPMQPTSIPPALTTIPDYQIGMAGDRRSLSDLTFKTTDSQLAAFQDAQ